MPELKLTEKRVRALTPPVDSDYVRYWDTEVRGLCVKVTSSGSKRYLFKGKRQGESRPIWHTGPRCSEYSLEDMRDDVRKWKLELGQGVNPFHRIEVVVPTVYELCLENLERKRGKRKPLSPKTLADYEHMTECIRRSSIAGLEANEVSISVAYQFLKRYEGQARQHDKLRWWLRNCFELGTKREYIPLNSNPWHYVDKIYELPEADELPRFTDNEIARLAYYLRRAAEGKTKYYYSSTWISFIWFLIRNGTRPGETCAIEWDWLKSINGQWVIRHPQTKTGAKLIYLSEASVRDIGVLARKPGLQYVFPGRIDYLRNYSKGFSAIRKESGLNKPPYAIRRWFARTGRLVYKGEIKPVQGLCGWETEEMALRYTGEDEELLENVIMENAEVCKVVGVRVSEVVDG